MKHVTNEDFKDSAEFHKDFSEMAAKEIPRLVCALAIARTFLEQIKKSGCTMDSGCIACRAHEAILRIDKVLK